MVYDTSIRILQLYFSCKNEGRGVCYLNEFTRKSQTRVVKSSKNYTYDEARALLRKLGFEEKKGKTSGSRVMFYRESDQRVIMLHKPHPEKTMDSGALKDLIKKLKEFGEI